MTPWLVLFAALSQDFTQRGFIQTTGLFYPQKAPNDAGHAVGEGLFRYEASYKLAPGLKLSGGLDARTDTHRYTEREWGLSWWDRSFLRPAFAVRSLSATYSRGKLTLELGKQFIRWGKTDVLNPTDRFAPRDFVNVVDNEFLAVTAARATYGTQSDTLDLVYQPRLTPSRIPLLNQRWAVLPPGIPIVEGPPEYPGGGQFGARWNHIGKAAEYSLSYYEGYDNLPLFAFPVHRYYPFYAYVRRGLSASLALRDGEGGGRLFHLARPPVGRVRLVCHSIGTDERRVDVHRRVRRENSSPRMGRRRISRRLRGSTQGVRRTGRVHDRHQPVGFVRDGRPAERIR